VTCYSLIAHLLDALKPLHLGVDPEVVTGAASPAVLALVWLVLRHLRKKLFLQ
jgi:uncharacterized membrane-anchored protein